MKKRITTVVLSMVLIISIVMAVPARIFASSRSYTATVGGARYGLLVEATRVSSTTAKGEMHVEHISGTVLNFYSGYVTAIALDGSGIECGRSVTLYEKNDVDSFSVSATYVRSDGGVVGAATICTFFGTSYSSCS